MSIITAKDIKKDDVISSAAILEKIGTYGRVIGILDSKDGRIFRLTPYNVDSFLTIRLDAEMEEKFIKHF